MKFLILFFSSVFLALAQDPSSTFCQCPEVRCHADDPMALCQCLNGREERCQSACPEYMPTILPCLDLPAPARTPAPALADIIAGETSGSTADASTSTITSPSLDPPLPPLFTFAPLPPEVATPILPPIEPSTPGPESPEFTPAPLPAEVATPFSFPDPDPDPEPSPPVPQIQPPVFSTPLPIPIVSPEPAILLPFKPQTCTCEPTFCIQSWPASCTCSNAAALACYEKCGGPAPAIRECPVLDVRADGERTSEDSMAVDLTGAKPKRDEELAERQVPAAQCVCETTFCVMSFPAGCYCQNDALRACYRLCGGAEPKYQICEPPSQTFLALPSSSSSTKPLSTPNIFATPLPPTSNPATPQPLQKSRHAPCGGMLAGSTRPCATGYICIDDPFEPGCGPACDAPGICVLAQRCGGFPGLPCPRRGYTCVDDPRDGCDPASGGRDCYGLCVWPHSLRG